MSGYLLAHGNRDLDGDALLIADQGDSWAEVIEITDLDSAVGTTGLVEVRTGQVTLPYRFAKAREAIRRAWESCGGPGDGYTLTGHDRATGRLMAFGALWEYGCNRDIEQSWTIAITPDYSEWAGPDIWRVTRARGNDSALHPIRVNGPKGLRRWLRRELGVEVPE